MRREVRYVLHMWQDAPRPDAWRARLEELATRDVKHFANLADLAQHLLTAAHGAAEVRLEEVEPDTEER